MTLLPHAGHEVREASNGAEGLGMAKVHPPDLVIADALMPKMDGYELVRQLRLDPATAGVKVIFYTAAYLVDEVHKLAEGCGISHVLVKPTEPQIILDTVAAALAEGTPSPMSTPDPDVHREHLLLLNEKLVGVVKELETANQERRRLLAYLVRAQEEERRSIAGDIHDDAVQAMAAAAMRLELLERKLPDPELKKLLVPVVEVVRSGIERLRRLMFQLRPPALDAGGLASALDVYLNKASVDGGYGYDLTTNLADEPPDALRVLFYRIAQEALVNVAKHASASHVVVELGQGDEGFWMRVSDNGVGFAFENRAASMPGHLGIDSMRERVEMANGRWRLESKVGEGTTVECWIPAGAQDPEAGAAGDTEDEFV
jgi:signal transduction histidine kinase